VSSRLATLAELDDVYGAEAMYMLLEIAAVDAHNQRIASKVTE
jgi:hypothetical protein